MKIVALASTNGTDLQAVLDEINLAKLPGVELTKVISNNADSGALSKAQAHGVPAIFLDPKGKTRLKYDQALIEEIGEVDLICLIGYMRILSPVFVRHYAGKIINVHPSLLPKYGGKGWMGNKIHEAVLANGDKETGMTIHFVDESVDGGPILLQQSVEVSPIDTVDSLRVKVQELEKTSYPEAIRMLQKQLNT
jgi:phosphoribosylglycinamide formyltransferase-1